MLRQTFIGAREPAHLNGPLRVREPLVDAWASPIAKNEKMPLKVVVEDYDADAGPKTIQAIQISAAKLSLLQLTCRIRRRLSAW